MSKSEYEIITAAAQRAHLSISEWSRQALLAAARADAARDGLTEVQDALDRTLRRHLRHVSGLAASTLRETAIARKLVEQVLYLIGWPERSLEAALRRGPQGILQRAEAYAQEQVRRATERRGVSTVKSEPAEAEEPVVPDDGGAA